MKLTFENGKFQLNDTPQNIPDHSQALETIGLIQSWKSGTEVFSISTSGTTGDYKTIALHRKHLEWSARQTAKACKLGKREKEYCCLPISKVGGMMQIIRSLVFNRDLKVVDPVADPMSKLEKDHPYTLTSLTPYQFYHIFNHSNSLDKLARFEAVLIGGGPVSLELEYKIKDFCKWVNTRFYHTYGMTETASHIALRPILFDKDSNRFKPFDGVEITKDEDSCMQIHILELGLHISTHDMIDFGKKGFSFIGRKDNIINSGGLKIIPEPIERSMEMALLEKNLKIPMYLKGIPDEALGQKCVLVLQKKDREHLSLVRELFGELVETYQRPKDYLFVDRFKYTRTNKLLRY